MQQHSGHRTIINTNVAILPAVSNNTDQKQSVYLKRYTLNRGACTNLIIFRLQGAMRVPDGEAADCYNPSIRTLTMLNLSRIQDPNTTVEQVLIGSDQVLLRLRTLAASIGPQARADQFYIRARAKTMESVLQKIRLRREIRSKQDYSFRNITDYVGFRIVTLYDDQLPSAVDHVINVVNAGRNISQPLFAAENIWDSFHDAKFSARTENVFDNTISEIDQTDVYYACLSRLLELIRQNTPKLRRESQARIRARCEALPRKKAKANEGDWYSSAHLTFWATAYFSNDEKISIPVEFQIRTAIEDVWAEINHKLLYKSESRFIWSVGYEDAVRNARGASNDLKSSIEDIPQKVELFRNFSKQSSRIAFDYWGEGNSLRPASIQRPTAPLSLCAALIYRVDGGNATMEIADVVRNYEGRMAAVSEAGLTVGEIAEELWRCIHPLQRLARQLKIAAKTKHPDVTNTEKTLNYQRYRLLQMEALRLEALILLRSSHRLLDQGGGVEPVDEEEGKKIAVQLYKRFCNFVDDRKLRIRPMTMLYTWKYMLANRFNKSLATENIFTAQSVLKADTSLPSWSVYRVLVPSCIASALYEEAKSLHNSISMCEVAPSSMSNLSIAIKDKLRDAVRFALQAFDEHTDTSKAHSERRGDIGFLPRSYVPIREADTVMAIVLEFDRQYSSYIGAYSAVVSDRIRAVYEYILGNKLSYDRRESRSEMYLLEETDRTRLLNDLDRFRLLCQR